MLLRNTGNGGAGQGVTRRPAARAAVWDFLPRWNVAFMRVKTPASLSGRAGCYRSAVEAVSGRGGLVSILYRPASSPWPTGRSDQWMSTFGGSAVLAAILCLGGFSNIAWQAFFFLSYAIPIHQRGWFFRQFKK